MSSYKEYLDDFDPRKRDCPDEFVGAPGAGASSSDDFTLFNFEEARRRRDERQRAQLAADRPRELTEQLDEMQRREEERRRRAQERARRERADRQRQRTNDGAADRAAALAANLSSVFTRMTGSAQSSPGRGSSGRAASGSTRSSSRPASGGTPRRTPTKKKTGTRKRLPTGMKVLLVLGCVFLTIVIIYYSAFASMLSGMGSLELSARRDAPASAVAGMELAHSGSVTNILLLGIDDDGSDGSRSDTVMLLSLDTSGGSIRLCSILRDCYVEIPGKGRHRINAAYAYGGAQLAAETVESNLRVRIDHCVTIDMKALADVVDAVGGVTIELTAAEANQVNLHSHCGLTTSEGKQRLNGKQAVTYAQIRKIDSDFARTGRQRTLMNAILAEVRGLGLGGLVELAKTVAPRLSTDMTSTQIANLALSALPALSGEFEQMTVPADGAYREATINGMSVLELDMARNAELLREYLYGKPKS